MTTVTTKKHHISPTMRWADAEGRLTGEGFRLMRAIAELVEAVTVDDGEIGAGKIAAGAINATDIIVENLIVTGHLTANSVTDITAGTQVSTAGPNGFEVVSVAVPVNTTGNTGVLISFTAFMSRPSAGTGNFGFWRLSLKRNGVVIDSTPSLFYDDNFAYPVVASFVDLAPGADPTYVIATELLSGDGNFEINGGLLNCSLLKR